MTRGARPAVWSVVWLLGVACDGDRPPDGADASNPLPPGADCHSPDPEELRTDLTVDGAQGVVTGDPGVPSAIGRAMSTGDLFGSGSDVVLVTNLRNAESYPKDAVHVLDGMSGALSEISAWTWEDEEFCCQAFGSGLEVGDADGDGTADVAIGATAAGYSAQGKVYLFRGPFDAARMPQTVEATAVIEGNPVGRVSATAMLGEFVAGAAWIAVGAPDNDDDPEMGEVALFPGDLVGPVAWDASAGLIRAVDVNTLLGATMASGDLTGDGIAELVLAEHFAAPAIHVFHGGQGLPNGTILDADSTLLMADPMTLVFQEVIGDVDDDGHADIGIGIPVPDPFTEGGRDGEAWIVLGPLPAGTNPISQVGIHLTAERPLDNLGRSVHGPGDLDGDEVDDLLISAAGDGYFGTASPGVVYVFRGPLADGLGLDQADLIIVGECIGDSFGFDITSANLDGDALADVVISALGASGPEPFGGKLYTFTGASLTW